MVGTRIIDFRRSHFVLKRFEDFWTVLREITFLPVTVQKYWCPSRPLILSDFGWNFNANLNKWEPSLNTVLYFICIKILDKYNPRFVRSGLHLEFISQVHVYAKPTVLALARLSFIYVSIQCRVCFLRSERNKITVNFPHFNNNTKRKYKKNSRNF